MKSHLKHQIIARIMISILVALTVLFSFIFLEVRSNILQSTSDSINQRILFSASEVDKIIVTRIKIVESYARNIKQVYELPSGDRIARMDELTKSLLEENDPYVYAQWFTFESRYKNQGKRCSWFIKSNDGIVDAYSPDLADGSDPQLENDPDHDYYFGAKRAGKTHITVPYLDPYIHEWMISITTPVYDDNRELMGVAGTDIRLSEIQAIGSKIKIGKSGYALFASPEGEVIYHPRFDMMAKLNIGELKHPDLNQFFNNMYRHPQENVTETWISDTAYYFAAKIPSANWLAIIIAPKDEIEAPLDDIFRLSIGIYLLFLLVCYVIVHLWVDRTIHRPMNELLKGTERVAQGILDSPIHSGENNEFGHLAHKFNIMMLSIRKNRELEHELKQLSALKLIGEMASIISHEIRNPLDTINLYLQIMKTNSKGSEEEQSFIQIMLEESERAYSIISEYLSLVNSKPSDFRCENINQIIQSIFVLMQALAHSKGQTIALDLQHVPQLPLDAKEIRQLLHNLIRNGLEAMDKGGILYIRTCRIGERVKLTIQDGGKGMDEHVLRQIGTPFITTKEYGTGLGLPICLGIIKRHEAEYQIHTSSLGTCFEIYFKGVSVIGENQSHAR